MSRWSLFSTLPLMAALTTSWPAAQFCSRCRDNRRPCRQTPIINHHPGLSPRRGGFYSCELLCVSFTEILIAPDFSPSSPPPSLFVQQSLPSVHVPFLAYERYHDIRSGPTLVLGVPSYRDYGFEIEPGGCLLNADFW